MVREEKWKEISFITVRRKIRGLKGDGEGGSLQIMLKDSTQDLNVITTKPHS